MNWNISNSTRGFFQIGALLTHRRAAIALLVPLFLVIIVFDVQGVDFLGRPYLLLAVCMGVSVFLASLLLVLSAVARVSEELIYFAAETAQEAGPSPDDLVEAARTFGSLFEYYDALLRNRTMTWAQRYALRRIFRLTELSTQARSKLNTSLQESTASLDPFAEVATILTRSCDSIHERFGSALYGWATKFSGRDARSFMDANNAINQFHIYVQQLAQFMTCEAAKQACLGSRRAGTILHCAWPEYQLSMSPSANELNQFARDLELCEKLIRDLAADSIEDNARSLLDYATSLYRRREALSALRSGDRPRLWNLLRSASKKRPPPRQLVQDGAVLA